MLQVIIEDFPSVVELRYQLSHYHYGVSASPFAKLMLLLEEIGNHEGKSDYFRSGNTINLSSVRLFHRFDYE